jgi:hypothetical protein
MKKVAINIFDATLLKVSNNFREFAEYRIIAGVNKNLMKHCDVSMN